MSDTKFTGHTITTIYSDDSVSAYKIKVDENNIWIEHGEHWITIPLDIVGYVIEAIEDLRKN